MVPSYGRPYDAYGHGPINWHDLHHDHINKTLYTHIMMDVIPFSEDGESQTALTISQSQGSLRNQLSKEKLEWLREQRESHKHKTIWTKDAHGCPYKKVWGVLF